MPVCPHCGIQFSEAGPHDCGPIPMPPALGLVVRVVFGMVLAMVGLAVLALLFFWWVMSGFKN